MSLDEVQESVLYGRFSAVDDNILLKFNDK
jgi:hypothetical protein